ncbi:MAG: hypothetical protein IJU50_04640 [Lachnospiraceae bacterium]|nr:hypothetical protein [Lachnospiraceae bacterium]
MSNNFEKQFQESMNRLCFSPSDKEKMQGKLMRSMQDMTEREDELMKKWTLPKMAIAAAFCLMMAGLTVFAASKITQYTSSSNAYYDYGSIAEMTAAQAGSSGQNESAMPEFPSSFGSGFVFDGGNSVQVSGQDDAGSTVDAWEDFRAVYKDKDGKAIFLTMSYKPLDEGGASPTETRLFNGIAANYSYDEYLFLPPSAEEQGLDPEVQERLENDDHFYVSYGSETPETKYFSGITFEKDGISFIISTYEDVSKEELFSIAEEIIDR